MQGLIINPYPRNLVNYMEDERLGYILLSSKRGKNGKNHRKSKGKNKNRKSNYVVVEIDDSGTKIKRKRSRL